jgi:hypothetical protein
MAIYRAGAQRYSFSLFKISLGAQISFLCRFHLLEREDSANSFLVEKNTEGTYGRRQLVSQLLFS